MYRKRCQVSYRKRLKSSTEKGLIRGTEKVASRGTVKGERGDFARKVWPGNKIYLCSQENKKFWERKNLFRNMNENEEKKLYLWSNFYFI